MVLSLEHKKALSGPETFLRHFLPIDQWGFVHPFPIQANPSSSQANPSSGVKISYKVLLK